MLNISTATAQNTKRFKREKKKTLINKMKTGKNKFSKIGEDQKKFINHNDKHC